MGWATTVVLNLVITLCYLIISGLVFRGLAVTRQLSTNPLALATSLIFLSCAAHHGHHALHVLDAGPGQVRDAFGTWHSVAVDVFGAVVAVTYVSLRRRYSTLLNTPSMFEDQVTAETERRLREMAYTDQLTELPNRTALGEVADELDRGQGQRLLVAYLDLDGFKQVNDTWGHDTGDRVLREVADRLKARCASYERIYRLGGDEFLVLAVEPPVDPAAGLERLLAVVAEPVGIRDGGSVSLGCSLGVAEGIAGADRVEDLMRRADTAMYVAKRKAGGVERFEPLSWDDGPMPAPRTSLDSSVRPVS